jgi:hypothetical protein
MAAGQTGTIDRRRLLALGGLVGIVAVGGGVIYTVSRSDEEVAARAASPKFVERISDVVLPATDTPGAVAAGVPAFLAMAFDHGLFGGNAATLAELEDALDQRSQARFVNLDATRQTKHIGDLDRETFARPAPRPAPASPAHAQNNPPGNAPPAPVEPEANRLWRIVKLGIVVGYYTSEIGGSKELAFEMVPGDAYRADVALGTVPVLSNQWMENAF